MSFEMFQWIVEISIYYRIFLIAVCLIFFIRMNDWWSFPIFILLSLILLALISIVIIEGSIVEIIMVIPAAILSIILAIRMISKRIKSGLSLYEGKGFDLRFPSLK